MAYKVLYISNSILKLKFTTNKKILNIRLLTYLRLGITHKGLSNVYLELPRLVLLHVFGPGNLVFMSSSKTLAMSSTSGKKSVFYLTQSHKFYCSHGMTNVFDSANIVHNSLFCIKFNKHKIINLKVSVNNYYIIFI
mgnify:CR=1 FL=1